MSQIQTQGLTAYYGDFQSLFGVDVLLRTGEVTAIIGANGAGKSTFMKALCGLVKTEPKMIYVDGEPQGGREPHTIISSGIAMVPEGRRLFPSLSVEENLLIGTHSKRQGRWALERIYNIFPILADRRNLPGTSLSGGQQQMVSIGRALLSNPTTLLCDEISLGLAPVIIEELYQILATLRGDGISIVIVEQDIQRAMSIADHVYCFQQGCVSLEGRCSNLSTEQISAAYFGISS